MAARCCQCNGVNVSCLPSKSNNCQNVLSCRQRAIVKAVCSPSVSCPSSTLCPSSPSDFIDEDDIDPNMAAIFDAINLVSLCPVHV